MLSKRDEYLMLISSITGIPSDDIMGRCRTRDISDARHLLMWALTRLCGYSTTQVGLMVHRDHASVVHSKNFIEFLPDFAPLRLHGYKKTLLQTYEARRKEAGYE